MRNFAGLILTTALLGCAPEAPEAPKAAQAATVAERPSPTNAAAVSLTRLACGTIHFDDLSVFSIAGKYKGVAKTLTDSCYLIRHGDQLLLWDSGLPGDLVGKSSAVDGMSLNVSIVDQLAELGIKPTDIDMVGISHFHGDHTGQLAQFPNATLLTGHNDWVAITAENPDPRINIKPYAHWISEGGKVKPVSGDYDVFGDGTVVMLALPGHTPGHHGLKVELPETGTVLLSGDVTHFTENYETNGVPIWNTDPEASVKSLKRFKQLAAETDALVVIQHEPDDIAKLPAFPAAAE